MLQTLECLFYDTDTAHFEQNHRKNVYFFILFCATVEIFSAEGSARVMISNIYSDHIFIVCTHFHYAFNMGTRCIYMYMYMYTFDY